MFFSRPTQREFLELRVAFHNFKRKIMSDVDTLQAALVVTDGKVETLSAINTILVNSYGTLAAQIAALQNAGNGTGVIAPSDMAALLQHISQVNVAIDAVTKVDTDVVTPPAVDPVVPVAAPAA